MHPAGRALIGLWAGLALLAGGGAAVLWRLGTPPGTGAAFVSHREAVAGVGSGTAAPPAPHAQASGTNSAPPPRMPTSAPPAPVDIAVSPPLPALAEPAADFPGRTLPVIAADGRTPAATYAARAGLPATGPQVAILLEGLGLSDTLDHQAVDTLPPQISLAVSPYADGLDRPPGDTPLLDAARHVGHELWLSLPMEPAGSPVDSEGPQALSMNVDLAKDRTVLLWCLARFPGYVGLTNALGGLRGDRFASSSAFAMVVDALKQRGLAYVDAGLAPHDQPTLDPPGAHHADLTIDDSPDASDIGARLSRLEQLAQTNGSALGIAGPLRPTTLERIRAWSRGLHERGIALVPVSALPPPHPPVRDIAPAAPVAPATRQDVTPTASSADAAPAPAGPPASLPAGTPPTPVARPE